jgi:hypothetical protein
MTYYRPILAMREKFIRNYGQFYMLTRDPNIAKYMLSLSLQE